MKQSVKSVAAIASDAGASQVTVTTIMHCWVKIAYALCKLVWTRDFAGSSAGPSPKWGYFCCLEFFGFNLAVLRENFAELGFYLFIRC